MKTRGGRWMAIAGTLLLTAVTIWSACSPGGRPADAAEPVLTASHEEAEAWADKTLASLSLERKVAQMICEQMRGEYAAEDSPAYRSILGLVRDHGIGAVVLYGGSPHDTAALLNRLQAAADLPLLVSSDFEGGPGQQIIGASEFPANMALSAVGSEDLAYELGKAGAAEGRALGIHLTYSPVVDVQTRPDNPVLGVRSFGPDINLLGRLAGAYIRGYQENGMLATAKHYPGRGDVELIPGTEFTINPKPVERVEAEDFAAFRKAIEAGVSYVMSEHIAIPSAADGSELPASVEPALATGWLKEKLGFEGVLTTDDMWYAKMVDRFGPVEACVLAVEAGHDAVLKPADAVATIEGLVQAVRSGRIPEAQIDVSVRKILYRKARLNLHRERFVDLDRIPRIVGNAAHRALVRRIADESLTLVKNDGLLPLPATGPGRVVHLSIQRAEVNAAPAAVDAKIKAAFPGTAGFMLGPHTSPDRFEQALAAVRAADTVLVSLFHPRTVYKDYGPLSSRDRAFLDRVFRAKPNSVLVMSYGNPYVVKDAAAAAAVAVGYGEGGFYGNQLVYADSLIALLKGEIGPKGRLPVDVSAAFPKGMQVTY